MNPERVILAKILWDDKSILRIKPLLSAECFLDAKYRALYELCSYHAGGGRVDLEMIVSTILSGDGNGKVKSADVIDIADDGDPGEIDSVIEELRGRVPPVREEERKDLTIDQLSIKGMAEEFADLFASRLESPWSFFAVSFLTVLGAVLSDKLRIPSIIITDPRMYTVILGESADDRKSEAIKQTIGFFRRYDLLEDLSICYGVGSAEGLAEKMQEGGKKVLLVFDELKTFVSKSSIETAILLPAVNSLFEDHHFESQTKSHKIKIDDGKLSVLAASTIDTWSKMFSPIFTDIGFLNRLWIVSDRSERKYSIPEEIPGEKQQRLADKVKMCCYRFRSPTMIRIGEGARAIYDQWYMDPGNRGIHSKRLDTYGIRLMMIMAANEDKDIVDDDLMERIVGLLDWERRLRIEYDPVASENIVAKLEFSIRKALKRNNLSKRDLRRATNADRDGLYLFNSALENLRKEGEIKFDLNSKLWFMP